MAENKWAKVYFKDKFAGILEQRPAGAYLFTYDDNYRKTQEAISKQLPTNKKEHLSHIGLHSFFNNLVAEGPLARIQAKAIGTKPADRFSLLLAFGFDLVGAVTIVDPDPSYEVKINSDDYFQELSLASRASISGLQTKLYCIRKGKLFYPAGHQELSTHIAKFPGQYPLMVENEFLCMKATELLLFSDQVAEVEISEIEKLGKALLVKRFDRRADKTKLHFEEFTQLLNEEADAKYDSSYKDMADYMSSSSLCTKADMEKILRRIFACILFGNADAHLKNFALLHQDHLLSPSPVYDMVFTRYYDDHAEELALAINKGLKPRIQDIKFKHLVILAKDFGFDERVLFNIKDDFEKRLPLIYQFIDEQQQISLDLRTKFKIHIEKRWRTLFKNIGQN